MICKDNKIMFVSYITDFISESAGWSWGEHILDTKENRFVPLKQCEKRCPWKHVFTADNLNDPNDCSTDAYKASILTSDSSSWNNFNSIHGWKQLNICWSVMIHKRYLQRHNGILITVQFKHSLFPRQFHSCYSQWFQGVKQTKQANCNWIVLAGKRSCIFPLKKETWFSDN